MADIILINARIGRNRLSEIDRQIAPLGSNHEPRAIFLDPSFCCTLFADDFGVGKLFVHRGSGVDHGSVAVQANNEIAVIRRVVVLDRVLLVKLISWAFVSNTPSSLLNTQSSATYTAQVAMSRLLRASLFAWLAFSTSCWAGESFGWSESEAAAEIMATGRQSATRMRSK